MLKRRQPSSCWSPELPASLNWRPSIEVIWTPVLMKIQAADIGLLARHRQRGLAIA